MSCRNTIFGTVPDDWHVSSIGDIMELKQGLQISKKLRSEVQGIGYVPLLKITDLPQKVFSEYVKDVPESNLANYKDIIYTRTGQVGLVYTGISGCVHNNCFKVIPDESKLDRLYVYYYLKSNRMCEYANNIASGSVQKDLTHKAFKTVVIGYPEIGEQRRIACILSSLDRKIELNNEMNKTLEEMAQALFKRWFVDFEFPDEEGKSYKSSGGEMIESEIGLIPKEWNVSTMNEICDINKNNLNAKEKLDYINYLDTANITENRIDTIQKLYFKNDKVPSRAKRKVKNDSIIYSTVRPNQLHYGILKEPVKNMIVSTGFIVIDSKYDFLKSDFIYYWLIQKDNIEKMQAIAETSTSTYPSIKSDDIKKLKLVVPSKKVLENLSNKLNIINRTIYEYEKESKKLIEIRDILLPKLMSGEIRADDIKANL